jgi:drug/metabolite transporter (DMT)-like permease
MNSLTGIFATALFGLAASVCWGSGDFSGGLASRRINASSVVIAGYTVGFVLLLVLALLWREPFPAPLDVLWGGLAGLAGALGMIAFYTALASGKMGIAAPVSAVLTAMLPVLFSALTAGLPGPLRLGGFVLALLAITLISRPDHTTEEQPQRIGLAVLAGLGFGCFFVLISRVSPGATFWPLAVARLASVVSLLAVLLLRRQQTRQLLSGVRRVAPLVLLAGTLDAMGNAFFVLAAHSGRLDVAAVLSSLYPAATVLLAAMALRERVTRMQTVGILLALLAIPLISAQL